jgi:peptide/nickel transport system ATP-binding protein/oligopeptide transport system ATP-binding protein
MALLEVVDLVKVFSGRGGFFGTRSPGLKAVDGVSFRVEKAETLALVGESGAGKSTLGRLILRLIEPDSGLIRLGGRDIREVEREEGPSWRRRVQMIFQDPYSSFDPRVTIGESIGEPLLIHFGMKRRDRRRRSIELLDRVGMGAHHMERFPRELSGGQLQRAAVARALTMEPELIVCDEPVAALDVSIRAQVLNLLTDLQDERGLSYLFISHDLALVEVFADRVAVMRQGRIVELQDSRALYEDPQHEYTRELLAAIPKLPPASLRVVEAEAGILERASGH